MNRRGNSLVGMMATIAIIGVLAVGMFYGSGMLKGGPAKSGRKDGLGKTVPGMAKLSAKDTVCRNNLSQVRSAIQIAQTASGDDVPPQTLEETRIGSSFYECPIGKERYAYDPATGQVGCPHPGHEKY
ncbi:MAG: type II secretion system protein [Fimbriimonas sp.]